MTSKVRAVPVSMPLVSCLCPTYQRPGMLANVVACFLAQDYPPDRRELIILDDAGQYASCSADGWHLISLNHRFRSLPEKYNAIAGLSKGEILIVWEDDDIYLPSHISNHVLALQHGDFSKPSKILSLYTEKLQEEPASGRFHGSIAFKRSLFNTINGWPLSQRGDFDQELMTRLSQHGKLVDTCQYGSPCYVFRWGSTNSYHGQSAMHSPTDEQWYDRCQDSGESAKVDRFSPVFDTQSREIISRFLGMQSGNVINPDTFLNKDSQVQERTIQQTLSESKVCITSNIPVYITCYNVLSWPKRLAQQCQELGFIPVLVDNASTYLPLLEWYDSCPYEVVRLDKNYGCYGFWQLPIAEQQKGYYVVTDCDLDLSGIPRDLAERLIEVFGRHTDVTKVGLSLEINDIPDTFLLKESVVGHESQFWKEQREPGVWQADIGATFALYHSDRDTKHSFYRGLRLDRPYTARHLPWYLDRTTATDEHRFYFERIETLTHWGNRMKDLLKPVLPADTFIPPSAACPFPERWTATAHNEPEIELYDFIHSWIRVQKPEHCLVVNPGVGEIARTIGQALRENGHGDQLIVTAVEHELESNRLLSAMTPTEIITARHNELCWKNNFQFVWIGSGLDQQSAQTLERLLDHCNGFIFVHACCRDGALQTTLDQAARQGNIRAIDIPTPLGLKVIESRHIRPVSKKPDMWHDLNHHSGAGGREDLQSGWHNLASDLFPGHDVLDVGAGLGGSRERLARTASRVRLQDSAPGLPVDLACPVTAIPDDDATAVTAFDVIEHIEDDEGFLDHLLRIARTHVFVTTPNWFVSQAINHCHVREYTPSQFESLCCSKHVHLRYWIGDPTGNTGREVLRDKFLITREPHLGILLTHHQIAGLTPPSISSADQLEQLFQKAVSVPSDINQHCARLKSLSEQCHHVTEFGMRPAASTAALLAGGPNVLVSYDRVRYCEADLYESVVGQQRFRFCEGDSLSVDIEPTDLLFIDTRHTAEQLSQELVRHADRVNRWIVLHDTDIYGERGEDGGPGLLHAVRDFLQSHSDWSIRESHAHQYGLMVLERYGL